jgi:hypothetical protein
MYYDSMYTLLNAGAEDTISHLCKPRLKVEVMKLTKQTGSKDCGLYSTPSLQQQLQQMV